MVRPFALVGLGYLLTLTAAVYFGPEISLVLGCICLLGFCALALIPKTSGYKILLASLLTAALAFGNFSLYDKEFIAPATVLDNQDAVITGTICELPYKAYGRFYYTLKVDQIEMEDPPQIQKLRLSTRNALDADIYGTVKGKVHFYSPNGENGFSSRSYYASKGITMFAYLYEYEEVKTWRKAGEDPYYHALVMRRKMISSVRDLLPQQESALINGIFLGEKNNLAEQVQEDFKTAGVSHLLSVSGLHMATMAQFFLLLLGLFRVPKRKASFIAMAAVFVFMAVTGFVPSVMRSGIMYLIYLFGNILDRKADSLNSLGISAVILCSANPYAAADTGLLLSFSATAGLILFSGRISAWSSVKYQNLVHGRFLLDAVNTAVSTTVAATIFTLPILVLSFGAVSLIAPLANLLLLVPSTLLMELSLIAALLNLSGFLTFLAMPFAFLAGLLAKFMLACTSCLAELPFASVAASQGFVKFWLAACIILVSVAFACNRKPPLRLTAALSLLVLLCGIFSYQLSIRNITRVSVLKVGSGVSVVLTQNGRSALIGCGGYTVNTAVNYLRSQGVQQLDYLQTVGQGEEEYLMAAEIIEKFFPKQLLMQEDSGDYGFFQKSLACAKSVFVFQKEASAALWDTVEISNFYSGAQAYTGLTVNGVRILICPNGCDGSRLPTQWRLSDFVIAGEIPKDRDFLQPFATVLSMSEEDAAECLPLAGSFSNVVVSTGEEGNFILDVHRNGSIRLRREI